MKGIFVHSDRNQQSYIAKGESRMKAQNVNDSETSRETQSRAVTLG